MNMITSYLFLAFAVVMGVTSNSFAKSSAGFTYIIPSISVSVACRRDTRLQAHLVENQHHQNSGQAQAVGDS